MVLGGVRGGSNHMNAFPSFYKPSGMSVDKFLSGSEERKGTVDFPACQEGTFFVRIERYKFLAPQVPFVVPQAIDEYAVRDSPWAPWPPTDPPRRPKGNRGSARARTVAA